MKKKILILMLNSLTLFGESFAQLQSGSIAPNFTMTDLNGTQHSLYDYLNNGKTVYIDFFACHCPFCWAYHSTHSLADLHDNYGPNTDSDSVFVFAIELDANNGSNEFLGLSGSTQGNWVEGTNYPIFNPEGGQLSAIVSDFEANYYPLIYAICPDKTIEIIGTKTTNELYAHAGSCASINLGLKDNEAMQVYSFLNNNDELVFSFDKSAEFQDFKFEIVNINGNKIAIANNVNKENNIIPIGSLKSGIYFLNLIQNNNVISSNKFNKN